MYMCLYKGGRTAATRAAMASPLFKVDVGRGRHFHKPFLRNHVLIWSSPFFVRVVNPSSTLCAEFKLAEVCTLMAARAGTSVEGMPEWHISQESLNFPKRQFGNKVRFNLS